MKKSLKILLLEDKPSDAKLIQLELRKTNKKFESRVVQDKKKFLKELAAFQPDLILSDYSMPQFTGLNALDIVKKKCPEIPFIIVTAPLNEETAVKCIRWGAWDYVIKDKLVHLGHAVKNAIKLKAENERIKQVEKSLIKSEEQLKAIVSNVPVVMWALDKDGIFTLSEGIGLKVLGLKPGEIVGQSIFDVYHDVPQILEDNRRALAGELFSTIVDMGNLVFESHYSPIRDDKGKVVGMTGLSLDITKRKRAEKTLQKSEQELNAIFNGAKDGIVLLDKTGKILRINKYIVEIGGYAEEKFVGKRFNALKMFPLKSITKMTAVFGKLIKGKDISYEVEVYTKRGEKKIVEIHNSFLKKEGKVEGVIVILRDITERKKAEEEIKQLHEYLQLQIDRMPIGLIVWDKEFCVTSWNPSAERIFGFTAEEAFGKHPYNLIVPGEVQQIVDEIWSRLLEGDKSAHSINENITKDGHTITCNWSNTPLKKADGTVIGVLSMVQDITDHKKAEEALRIERDNLKNIFEAMEDGVYIVNQQYDIQYVNPVLVNDFGAYEGRKCYEYFHDRTEVCPWCKNPDVFAGKTVRWEWFSFKNQRTYDLIDTSLKDPDGNISKLEIFRDITERKKAEEDIKKRNEELEIFNRMAVGREIKMIELKKEINSLLEKAGEKPAYEIVE
jgi:PAS domain S-box-containing protein